MRLSHAMALFCLVAACDSPSSGNGTPAPRGDTAQADTSNPRGNPDPVDPGPTDPGPSQCHQCQRQRRQLLRARGLGLVHPRRPDPDRPEPRPRHRSRPGYRPRPERRVHRLWRFVHVRQRLLFRRLRLRHWHLQLTAPRRQSNSELFLRPRTASVQAGELVLFDSPNIARSTRWLSHSEFRLRISAGRSQAGLARRDRPTPL